MEGRILGEEERTLEEHTLGEVAVARNLEGHILEEDLEGEHNLEEDLEHNLEGHRNQVAVLALVALEEHPLVLRQELGQDFMGPSFVSVF